MNRAGPTLGQSSSLAGERASESGSVPPTLPTEAGRMPALHCGSRKGWPSRGSILNKRA